MEYWEETEGRITHQPDDHYYPLLISNISDIFTVRKLHKETKLLFFSPAFLKGDKTEIMAS